MYTHHLILSRIYRVTKELISFKKMTVLHTGNIKTTEKYY